MIILNFDQMRFNFEYFTANTTSKDSSYQILKCVLLKLGFDPFSILPSELSRKIKIFSAQYGLKIYCVWSATQSNSSCIRKTFLAQVSISYQKYVHVKTYFDLIQIRKVLVVVNAILYHQNEYLSLKEIFVPCEMTWNWAYKNWAQFQKSKCY